MHIRDIFLDELIRLEGLGNLDPISLCAKCGLEAAVVQCEDCFSRRFLCEECMCEVHADEPLHRIKVRLHWFLYVRWPDAHTRLKRWVGLSFVRSSLYECGLTVHLGHDGAACPIPHPPCSLTLVDITGIHQIRVQFCGCGTRHFIQLLRTKWWPASFQKPRSAFTLRLLKFFHALNVSAKTNLYEFYQTLVKVTDGSGVYRHIVCLLFLLLSFWD